MKRKIRIFISIFLLCLVILGGIYYFFIYNSVKVISLEGDFVASPDIMSNSSEIILYGSTVDKFLDRKHVNNYSEGILSDFYTLTKFKIKEVIKNSTGLKIKKGSLFEVIEPITVIQRIDGKTILELTPYKAMKKNINYIVYLSSNGLGGYSVVKYDECDQFIN